MPGVSRLSWSVQDGEGKGGRSLELKVIHDDANFTTIPGQQRFALGKGEEEKSRRGNWY